MRSLLSLLFLTFFIAPFAVLSQTINMNDSWQFQRLDTEQTKKMVVNPGNDWYAQFSIIDTTLNAQLRVPDETLRREFAELKGNNWETVRLPHTAFVEPLTIVNPWEGVCYYKKTIVASPQWKGQRVWMEFGAAMQLADIWVNGQHLMQNAGGYTPFVLDLTDHIRFNKPNEILVRLDNRDNPLIPPGKPIYKLDFCYYSGLYRDVNLIVKPKVHISNPILANKVAGGGVFVTYSDVSKKQATVNVKTHVVNSTNKKQNIVLRQRLFEMERLYSDAKKGKEVLVAESPIALNSKNDVEQGQTLTVPYPRLWSPDSPSRYILETEIVQGGKVIDKEVTKIGIRHIKFSKDRGFEINGNQVRLVGSNRHQEYPYLGNAISNNAQFRDMYDMRKCGLNIVRLGHYPQDPSVLDACDELGLLAIEPMPGWQYFNRDSTFINFTFRDIQLMIRRDRNHPSIVVWETTINEVYPKRNWTDPANATAHNEFPTDQFYASGEGYGENDFDLVYNEWDEKTWSASHTFSRPTNTDKPGFIREYYDFEMGGHKSSTRVTRGDGEKALLQNLWNAQWSHNINRTSYPHTSGDATWSMYDYNRGYANDICKSGMADIFRIPKFSYHFFQSQVPMMTPMPYGSYPFYIFIANQWTERPADDNQVIVYGNVQEMELFVNGKSIGKQKPDNGPDTPYVPQADGGNCQHLQYAPFTFKNVSWEKGTLEAVGYVMMETKDDARSTKVAQASVKTPEQPAEMKITYFESGKAAATNDDLIVYVELRDKNGTLCVDNNTELVTLATDKNSSIVGSSKMKAEAGIASFIVKTTNNNKLKLTASSSLGAINKEIALK